MNRSLRVLGDIRASDQIIRLHGRPGEQFSVKNDQNQPVGELWEGRGTYIHEWSHYLQFSTTPLGIILSKMRRESFTCLIRVAGLMNNAPMPKVAHINTSNAALESYEQYIDYLGLTARAWGAWPDNWFLQAGESPGRINHIESTPTGLRVGLEGEPGIFSLPLGPSQIFEAWAWLEEQIHGRFMDVEIDYRPENLLYTWPVHLVKGIMGTAFVEDRTLSVFMSLIGLLFAASYYDVFAWSYHPFNKTEVGQLLIKKHTKIARVIYQLFKDYPNHILDTSREPAQEFKVAFDNYLVRNGLPTLSKTLTGLREAVATLIYNEEEDLRSQQKMAKNRGRIAIDGSLGSEIGQLLVTAKNLESLDKNLYEILVDPYVHADAFEPPWCADFNGRFYDWKLYTDVHKWEGRDFDDDVERLRLRQRGFTFLEHILHQVVFSEHVACYGSPFWPHPIENCEYIDECVRLKCKSGVAFCKEPAWRGLVSSYLIALAETYTDESKYKGVPGLYDIEELMSVWREQYEIEQKSSE